MSLVQVTRSEAATLRLGTALASVVVPGLRIMLTGPVGTGKTTLTRALVAALPGGAGVRVKSPTYALCHAYPTTPRLWHADLYRLRGAADVETLGFLDAVQPDDALVVEWADRAEALFDDALTVAGTPTGERSRRFEMSAVGPVATGALGRLERALEKRQ